MPEVRMIDWEPVVRAHRDRRAVRLHAGNDLAISAERAWRAVAVACAPFRLGTRFRTAPDVQLFTGHELVTSPGEQLPGDDDRSLEDYVARAAGGGALQLVVTHPLVVDFALWSSVRALVHGLFTRIGAPVLPVVSELVLGTFARSARGFAKRMDCAVLTCVLAGELHTRLWRTLWQLSPNEICDIDGHRPDEAIAARAGDIVYWPCDRWHVDEAAAPCLALRLWIPAPGADTGAMIGQALADLLGEKSGGEHRAVPYLPYHPADPRPRRHTARQIAQLAQGSELPRELAIEWVRRVSACGLEPVPAPREVALSPAARIRRDPRTPLIRMRWRGEVIWAANGHGFALRSGEDALRSALAELEHHDAEVSAVCGGDAGLHAALTLLAEVRAIVVTDPGETT